MTDKKLIEKYQNGSMKCFTLFYNKYKTQTYNYILWKVGEEKAADLFQESFRKFIDAAKKGKINDPKSYLFLISSNLVKNHYRDKLKTLKQENLNEEYNYNNYSELEDEITDSENQENLKKNLKLLADKKPDLYDILYLHIFADMTFDSISHILNINRNTVTSRYRYSLEYLRKFISKKEKL